VLGVCLFLDSRLAAIRVTRFLARRRACFMACEVRFRSFAGSNIRSSLLRGKQLARFDGTVSISRELASVCKIATVAQITRKNPPRRR